VICCGKIARLSGFFGKKSFPSIPPLSCYSIKPGHPDPEGGTDGLILFPLLAGWNFSHREKADSHLQGDCPLV
jgi:hypothetical protein